MKLDKQVRELSLVLYQDLDTPVSLGCYLLVKYGEWDQVASRRADPRHYLDVPNHAEKFRRDYQACELLRKYPGLPGLTAKTRRDAAVKGFWEAEKHCFLTNIHLDRHLRNYALGRAEMRLADFIDKVRKIIQRILGVLPDTLDGRFGPGATFESKGHKFASSLTVADKMSDTIHCTSSVPPLLGPVWASAWGRAVLEDSGHGPTVVPGNRFTTVPKDSQKDRGICIEPGGNLFLQLGVGRYIRRRLKLVGLDLQYGQDLHRRLARDGSISNRLATIDLSSASDTVSFNLVKLLLPEDWFSLLSDLRCIRTRVDGQEVFLEKFSSMGNGFTFELETLIFASLASAFTGERIGDGVYAYGDDIIIPARDASSFLSCLRYFGFIPNERKTFVEGPFRESCGGDFFCGVEVTPYHLTEEPHDPSEWISVANGLRRFGRNSRCFVRCWRRVLGFIPTSIRSLRGPVELGDLVIHDHPSTWQTVVRSSIRYVRVWRPVLRRVRLSNFTGAVQLATALYGSAEGGTSNAVAMVHAIASGGEPQSWKLLSSDALVPRNGVSGYRRGWVSFS